MPRDIDTNTSYLVSVKETLKSSSCQREQISLFIIPKLAMQLYSFSVCTILSNRIYKSTSLRQRRMSM